MQSTLANWDGLLAMPAALAVTALRNLLDNAIRYSPSDTEVFVRFETNGEWTMFWAFRR